MFNISDIVGELMQSGMSGSTNKRLRRTMGVDSDDSAGALGGLLSGLTGGGKSGGGGLGEALSGFLGGKKSGGGGGGGLGGVLGDVLGQVGKSMGNKKVAAGGIGALAGALLGGGKGSVKGALGGGAMAVLGALAFSALKGKMGGQSAQSVPLGLVEPETTEESEALEGQASLVLKAMLNAAKVDGKIDAAESQRILGNLEKAGADENSRNQVLAEMNTPLNVDEMVAAGRQDPQVAAQLYAASLLAIEVDTPTERKYLNGLADAMNLPRDATQHLEETLGVNT